MIQQLKTFLRSLVFFTLFLFTLVPSTFTFICVLDGKKGFITLISQIPEDNFWMFGIPLFLACFTASAYCFHMFIAPASSKPELENPKPKLSVDDPSLGDKLKNYINPYS